MLVRIFFVILLLHISSTAKADGAAYSGYHEIAVSNQAGSFRHVHDRNPKKPARDLYGWSLNATEYSKFFSEENDFSFVEYIDVTGKVRFRSPSPAFSKLWMSYDGRYLVGLSNIKLYNPYQLVVWSGDGTILHRQAISSAVTPMSPEDRNIFESNFPKIAKKLLPRYFVHEGSIYLDIGGTWGSRGDDEAGAAWKYLTERSQQHPYGVDETASNYVFWYPECLEININKRQDQVPVLTIKKPDGISINIELHGVR